MSGNNAAARKAMEPRRATLHSSSLSGRWNEPRRVEITVGEGKKKTRCSWRGCDTLAPAGVMLSPAFRENRRRRIVDVSVRVACFFVPAPFNRFASERELEARKPRLRRDTCKWGGARSKTKGSYLCLTFHPWRRRALDSISSVMVIDQGCALSK